MLQLAQTKADVLNRQIEKLQWELKILASNVSATMTPSMKK
jgi:hypothetical protein